MTPWYLTDYLEESARRFPDRIAVVDSNGASTTYEELNRQAGALAAHLYARGVKRGDRVGIVMPKSIAAVASIFGIMKVGATYVPVDASAPEKRTRRILADCNVRALIVDEKRAALLLQRELSDLAGASVLILDPTSPFINERDDPPAPAIATSPTDIAYILYTSGSTGMPKGVMISHANAMSFIDWGASVLALTHDDHVSSHAPFHFDYSVLDIYVTVKHGATLYLISEELGRNPKELARFIAASKLTIWSSTPSALMMLVQFGDLDVHDASSLRIVTFGGEVFPPRHLRELQRAWPSPTYLNLYGPTEITTACTCARIPSEIPANRDIPYPIGFAAPHCRALVLDDAGQEVPEGEDGLLYISGPSVFVGYWSRPAETAAAFLERAGTRWYNTGDVVRWNPDEGYSYVGRQDRMVKRRGFRIELGEIESALYLHPSVVEAATVSVPDAEIGIRIVAVVSCVETHHPSTIDFKTFCATRLPAYMIPDRFVFQKRLPRTSTDKVDYQILRSQVSNACVG